MNPKQSEDDLSDGRQPESVSAMLKDFAIRQALTERDETGISEPLGCTRFALDAK